MGCCLKIINQSKKYCKKITIYEKATRIIWSWYFYSIDKKEKITNKYSTLVSLAILGMFDFHKAF